MSDYTSLDSAVSYSSFQTLCIVKHEYSLFSQHAGLPRILSLQNVRNITSALLLNCTSTGSPASSVVWVRDGVSVADNEAYSTCQILRDGVTATYDNILIANAGPFELTGTYMCIIHDSLGHNSAPASVEVNGTVVVY